MINIITKVFLTILVIIFTPPLIVAHAIVLLGSAWMFALLTIWLGEPDK